jgi:hypothetical protein
MGGEPIGGHQFTSLFVVVALVQAETLGSLRGGPRPLDRDGIEGVLEELMVVTVGAFVGQADRYSGSFC